MNHQNIIQPLVVENEDNNIESSGNKKMDPDVNVPEGDVDNNDELSVRCNGCDGADNIESHESNGEKDSKICLCTCGPECGCNCDARNDRACTCEMFDCDCNCECNYVD